MIEKYYKVVDEAVAALGLDAEDVRGEQPGQWNLKKGRFDIMVDVWEQESQYMFQIVCPLCGIPEESREGFLLNLLQKNYGLSAMTYAVMDNIVFLKYTTEATPLTSENIVSLLTKTAFYAEKSEFVPIIEQ
ncbi:MAG: YbjN domain-containing protein [Bacteroidia bacterium]|nr:YbjN domain-containing protein [Bacteroidia bacterium]